MEQKTYTSYYDIEWPVSQAIYAPAEGVLKAPFTVTLTTRSLPDYERGQVTMRFRERLSRLEQEIDESGNMAITTRLLWRCCALACLQVHQELFALHNVGLMLIANGVQVGREYSRLHELLHIFLQHVARFPGLDVYYQLPNTLNEHVEGEGPVTQEPDGSFSSSCAVSILSRNDYRWDGVAGVLYEVAAESGDASSYAVLHVPESSTHSQGWYALRTEQIQRALRDGLVVARSDNWCRGFTFLHGPSERRCLDLTAALSHIQEDRQQLSSKGAQEGGGDPLSFEPSSDQEGR